MFSKRRDEVMKEVQVPFSINCEKEYLKVFTEFVPLLNPDEFQFAIYIYHNLRH